MKIFMYNDFLGRARQGAATEAAGQAQVQAHDPRESLRNMATKLHNIRLALRADPFQKTKRSTLPQTPADLEPPHAVTRVPSYPKVRLGLNQDIMIKDSVGQH